MTQTIPPAPAHQTMAGAVGTAVEVQAVVVEAVGVAIGQMKVVEMEIQVLVEVRT